MSELFPITTLEVRWFGDGALPDRLLEWFCDRCPGDRLEFPERRTDTYLYTPESDTTNIKQRQGNLELKWRETDWGVQQLGAWQGRLQRWQKWIYQDLTPPPELRGWFDVRKTRWQRQYWGVRCEIAQIEIPQHCGWSVAYEIDETEANDRARFLEVVAHLTQTEPPRSFGDRLSCSYPHWLIDRAHVDLVRT